MLNQVSQLIVCARPEKPAPAYSVESTQEARDYSVEWALDVRAYRFRSPMNRKPAAKT